MTTNRKRRARNVAGWVAAVLTGIQFSVGMYFQITATYHERVTGTAKLGSISGAFVALGFGATLSWVIWAALRHDMQKQQSIEWVALWPNALGTAGYAILGGLILFVPIRDVRSEKSVITSAVDREADNALVVVEPLR